MKKLPIITIVILVLFSVTGCSVQKQYKDEKTYTDTVYSLERNNIDIHLDCMTSDSVETTDQILLVHGLTYSSHEFDVDYEDYSLVRFLCDHGYAVWRIDIAGYGQSENVADGFMVDSVYASEDVKAAIHKILSVSKADTIDLLGWSWGTVTSAIAENQCADVIDKYVLYAPILTGLGKADISEAFHENTWEHAASDFQMTAEGSIDEKITESDVVNTYCSNCWRYDRASSPNGGRRDLCVDASVELIDLTKIKDPTLIICGNHDPYLNMPLIYDALEKLPKNSELAIIDGASHCAMIEKPYYHTFQQKLVGFLK